MSNISTEESIALTKRGAFVVSLMPSSMFLASRSDPSASLACHDTVLRPLLLAASEAWAYQLNEASDTFAAAQSMLVRKSGKYSIDCAGEPIRGHEAFWNAAGGKRGSIVLLFEPGTFPAVAVFPHCIDLFILGNIGAAHSPAAIRYARTATSRAGRVAALLSRTNGMQWLSIHAAPDELMAVFALAKGLISN